MWHKIFFNAQSIQGETSGSVLIKMPNRSQFNGWVFWHPRKLVREQGGKGYHMTFSFNDEWVFKVKLYGRGRYNSRDVIRETELTASEMMVEFGVVDENVNDSVEMETIKIIEKETVITEVEHHIPAPVAPVADNTINDLKTTHGNI